MGHDVYGYRGKVAEGETGEEIAYLRRGAFNQLGREIYRALNATDCDNGCSGSGEDRYFSLEEIEAAIKRLPEEIDLQEERDFLLECSKAGEEGVTIGFY